jgi:hypothetical protein
MKTIVAVIATGVICAGGAHAYDAAVTPTQFAALKARVTTLEQFDKRCLRTQRLYENSTAAMAWGIGPPTPHQGAFYVTPDPPPLVCFKP